MKSLGRLGIFPLCLLLAPLPGCGSKGPETLQAGSQGIAQGTESSAGGGNAVVCFRDPSIPQRIRAAGGELDDRYLGQISSIEMLDLAQARQPRGAEGALTDPELISVLPHESPEDYVTRIANGFERVMPRLKDLIENGRKGLGEKAIYWTANGLRKINDENLEERIPSGCVLTTLAAQDAQVNGGQLRIDKRLYDHPAHSPLSKAVLFLHEYIYAQARLSGKKDSLVVRKIIGLIILKRPKYQLQELIDTLNTLPHRDGEEFRSGVDEMIGELVADIAGQIDENIRLFAAIHPAESSGLSGSRFDFIKSKLKATPETLTRVLTENLEGLVPPQESTRWAQLMGNLLTVMMIREMADQRCSTYYGEELVCGPEISSKSTQYLRAKTADWIYKLGKWNPDLPLN